jgi:hypothetical protein
MSKLIIEDSLHQELSTGDILMLALFVEDIGRVLEPAMLIKTLHYNRVDDKVLTSIIFLIKDFKTQTLMEYRENEVSHAGESVRIQYGIKIINPEFFLHDNRVSILLSQRPSILEDLSV